MAIVFVIVMASSSSYPNVNIIIIINPFGLVLLFHLICPCRSLCFEAPTTMSMQDPFSPPAVSNNNNKASRSANMASSSSSNNNKAVRNSSNFLSPTNEKAKLKVVNGIVSSPDNPATVRRLSQEDSSNTVSWHKRVVVHRVPRSDASRSMFVSSSQSKEGLSSQCCVIV